MQPFAREVAVDALAGHALRDPVRLTALACIGVFREPRTFQKRRDLGFFRLPVQVWSTEIDAILSLGVELKCNTSVGTDVTL